MVARRRRPPLPPERGGVVIAADHPFPAVQHNAAGVDRRVGVLLPVPVLVALVLLRQLLLHLHLDAHHLVLLHADGEHERAGGEEVVHAEHGLQGPHHLPHRGPGLGVLAQALVRHDGGHLGAPARVLALQGRVHDPVQPVGVLQVRPGPVHEVLLARPPRAVHRLPAGEQLQQHHAEAVHVALGGQVARQDVLGRRVPVRPHHTRRHVRLVPLRPVLGQTEVGQLGVVVLYMHNNHMISTATVKDQACMFGRFSYNICSYNAS